MLWTQNYPAQFDDWTQKLQNLERHHTVFEAKEAKNREMLLDIEAATNTSQEL